MAKIIGNTTATPNPQSDWAQTDATKVDYIKNKPIIQKDVYKITSIDTIYESKDKLPTDAENGNVLVAKTNGGTPYCMYSWDDSAKEWNYVDDLRGKTIYIIQKIGGGFEDCLYHFKSCDNKFYKLFISNEQNFTDLSTVYESLDALENKITPSNGCAYPVDTPDGVRRYGWTTDDGWKPCGLLNNQTLYVDLKTECLYRFKPNPKKFQAVTVHPKEIPLVVNVTYDFANLLSWYKKNNGVDFSFIPYKDEQNQWVYPLVPAEQGLAVWHCNRTPIKGDIFTLTSGVSSDKGFDVFRLICEINEKGTAVGGGTTYSYYIKDYTLLHDASVDADVKGIKDGTIVVTKAMNDDDGNKISDTYAKISDIESGAIDGVQGPQGEIGPQGPKGDTGERGPQGEQGLKGDKGDTGEQGLKGDTGNGISSIVKTNTNNLVDTYTITFTDGRTTTFTVTNGAPGKDGEQGPKGEQGDTPIKGVDYWNEEDKQEMTDYLDQEIADAALVHASDRDTFVKGGIVDNNETLDETDQDKACEWLGAQKKFYEHVVSGFWYGGNDGGKMKNLQLLFFSTQDKAFETYDSLIAYLRDNEYTAFNKAKSANGFIQIGTSIVCNLIQIYVNEDNNLVLDGWANEVRNTYTVLAEYQASLTTSTCKEVR